MEDQDICEEYRSSLLELTFNSKPLISMLTMLAEDNLQHAPKIVQVIETYLLKAKPEVKLPIMYLIDSIIKNVGRTYLNLFIQNIVSNFCAVFEKVDEKTRSQLFKLRQTWNDIFPSKKLYAIDVRVNQIDPAWPVTAEKPTQQTIHINPRFLENKPKTVDETESQQAQVRQQLLAKQQELIRLQQQKLELEILQTKAKLEQSRLTQAKEQIQVPVVPDVRLVRPDPRLVALNRDPRLVKVKPVAPPESIVVKPVEPKILPIPILPKPVETKPPPVVVHAVPETKGTTKTPTIVTLLPASRAEVQSPTPSASAPVCTNALMNSVVEMRTSPKREEKAPDEQPKLSDKKVPGKKSSPKKNMESSKKDGKDVKGGPPAKEKAKTVNLTGDSKVSDSKEDIIDNKPLSKSDKNATDKSKTSADTPVSPVKTKPKKDSPQSKTSSRARRERYGTRTRDGGKADSKESAEQNRYKKEKSSDSRDRERSRSPLKRNEKSSKNADSKGDNKKDEKDSKEALRQGKGSSTKKSCAGPQKSSASSSTDVDLRVYTSSAESALSDNSTTTTESPSRSKIQKGKSARDDDAKENESEPPHKRQKDDADLQSLFGAEDQDYRHLPQLVVKSPGQKGWAQYKELLSEGIRNAEEKRKEKQSQREAEDKDFRPPLRGERYPNRSRPFRPSPPGDSRNRRFDRLGRPLLNRMQRDSGFFSRRGGGFGRPYDRGGGMRKFDHYPKAQMQVEFMLSHQEQIMREAAEQLQAGYITKDQHCELMQQFEQLNAIQRMHGRRSMRSNLNMEHDKEKSSRADDARNRRPIDAEGKPGKESGFEVKVCEVPGSKSGREDTFGSEASQTILVDGQLKRIEFWGDSAIVLVDKDDPREMSFMGTPRKVFVDNMDPVSVSFDGEEKEFILNGKKHTVKFGCPLREVFVDGCPYQAQFGGPPIHILVDCEPHILRLEGPPPKVSISEHSRKDLLDTIFLSNASVTDEDKGNDANTSSPLDKPVANPSEKPIKSGVAVEGTDLKQLEDAPLAEPTPNDVDMRPATKEDSEKGDRSDENDASSTADGEKPLESISSMKDVDWRTIPRSESELPPAPAAEPPRFETSRNSPLLGDPVPGGQQQFLAMQENRGSPQQHDWERPMKDEEKRLHMLAHIQRDAEAMRRMHPSRREDWQHQRPEMWEWEGRNKFTDSPFELGVDGPGWRSGEFPDRGERFHLQEPLHERNSMPHFQDQRGLPHPPQGRGRIGFMDGRQPWEWRGDFREYNSHPVHGPRPSGMFPQNQGSPHHHEEQFRDRPHPMDHNPRNMFNRPPMVPPVPQLCDSGFVPHGMVPQMRPRGPVNDIPAYVSREVFFQGPGVPDGQNNMDVRPSRTVGAGPYLRLPGVNTVAGAVPLIPQNQVPPTDLPQQPGLSSAQPFVTPPNVDVSSLFSKLVAAGLIKNETPAETSTDTAAAPADSSENLESTLPEKKVQSIPTIELKSDSLKKRYPDVISALYQGTQCASCGLRFLEDQQDKYSQHLDWHFRVNRREKDGVKKAFSRKWFYDVEDWIQFEEIEDLEERTQSIFEIQAIAEKYHVPSPTTIQSVPASNDPTQNLCVVCGEPFELFWVEEEEEWHLKDALRVEEKSYHPPCYEDYKKSLEMSEESSSAVIPGLENATEIRDSLKSEEPVEPVEELDAKIKEEPKEISEAEDSATDDKMQEDMLDLINSLVDAVIELNAEVKTEPPEETVASEEIIIEVNEVPIEDFMPAGADEIMEDEPQIDPSKPREEPKMVVIQSGGITLKVKESSIAMPASPSTTQEAPPPKAADDAESEEEFRPPTPDPRFQVFPPVQKGTELSGLCSIM